MTNESKSQKIWDKASSLAHYWEISKESRVRMACEASLCLLIIPYSRGCGWAKCMSMHRNLRLSNTVVIVCPHISITRMMFPFIGPNHEGLKGG